MSDKILIIDDEPSIIKSLMRVLRSDDYADYELLSAESGAEALEILAQQYVDLIICDQMMPGMSGVDLLQRVRHDYPDLLTIMLTGSNDIHTAMDAINRAGVYKFILKPWNDDDLKLTIRRCLELRHLEQENLRLQERVRRQDLMLDELERRHPGILDVKRDAEGVIEIDL